jgi:hypothetical protein
MARTPAIRSNWGVSSTSGYSGSGVAPVSGASGTGVFPGPHMVEQQGLSITYARIPKGQWKSVDLTLSGVTNSVYKINNTKLIYFVTAYYSKTKVDAIFDTSTSQKPQKFEFLSVATDYLGNSYGTVGASALGPVGDILTSQPWYYRRLWDDSTDSEVSESITGCSYVYAASGSSDGIPKSYDQNDIFVNFEKIIVSTHERGSFMYDTEKHIDTISYPHYYLPGGYDPQDESLQKIIQFLDSVGNRLNDDKAYYAIPAVWNPDSGYSGGEWELDVGIANYGTWRHDYT